MLIVNRDGSVNRAVQRVDRIWRVRHISTACMQGLAEVMVRIARVLSIANDRPRFQRLEQCIHRHTTACVADHQPACGC